MLNEHMKKHCDSCNIKKYGYTDGEHSVYLCFRCGRYEGIAGGDVDFIETINNEPYLLLEMIHDKRLVPMS